MILELDGANKACLPMLPTKYADLYRLVMNKGIDTASTFTLEDRLALSGSVAGTTKALELQNGLLVFDDPNFGTRQQQNCFSRRYH